MFETLERDLARVTPYRRGGRLTGIDTGSIRMTGLQAAAKLGDRIGVETGQGETGRGETLTGEIVALSETEAVAMTHGPTDGLSIGAIVWLIPEDGVCPTPDWAGRVIDAFGQPLDGRPLPQGAQPVDLRRAPPAAHGRRRLGGRLNSGLTVFDTMLPIARGQRIGIFAGSGVGKSSLLADLARGVEADIVVYVLIGERGRELREFIEQALGPEGLARAVVVAATSDQSPLIKRRAAWMAMAVAEVFRDAGKQVLLLMDSLTRFAESHREIALTAGEPPSLRAYPPSTAALIAGLTERAGPGIDHDGVGDITAIFSVLVAGSDMEEPVADITRGLLDGHVILERGIAERGRFPAVDVRKSVSRSLPAAANDNENGLIARTRAVLAAYEQALPMIQTGLYARGSDPQIDEAIRLWPGLDAYFSEKSPDAEQSFQELSAILNQEDPAPGPKT